MPPSLTKYDNLQERAVSCSNLKNRSEGNLRYGQGDFDGWVKSLFNKLQFSSVLDVCCGTGNQLIHYSAKPEAKLVVGVDVSSEALHVAKERLSNIKCKAKILLKHKKMEEMFSDPELSNECFDLISCFYGIYYSEDLKNTLNEMLNHVRTNGTILIVGPYGKNNESLFNLLLKHYTLPDLVLKSATTFMEKDVKPWLSQKTEVSIEVFSNPIVYPDFEALVNYWRSSTFYSKDHESVVENDIKDHFSKYGNFIVEKHVMAIFAKKSI